MIPMHMIEELAELAGRDDPEVIRLVKHAILFPESRSSVYDMLQVKVSRRGANLGKRTVFGAPSVLPAEGRKIGDAMLGDSPQGDCTISRNDLPGNVGFFGGSGTGKSSLAGLICEYFMGILMPVLMIDIGDEYGWLIDRFGPERLLVIRARFFPLGLFVNPVGSRLPPLSWLAKITDVLADSLFLGDGGSNMLKNIVGKMYRERGVLDGSNDYPIATDVFGKIVTAKYSAGSRYKGFAESLVNRFCGLLQSFPGMNAKRSLVPEQVAGRSLIIRVADLSAYEQDIFINVLLLWLMCYKEGER